MDLYIGCPIWANKDWVGSFFPAGTKSSDYLRVYARKLNTVEGNTTFYAVPAPLTVEHWAKETPDSFRFCPKLPRTISHAGRLVDHLQETRQFINHMSLLGKRLGPIFLQLPPSYSPTMIDDLRQFLEDWPSEKLLAVEVRHTAWFEPRFHETLQALLTGFNAARVVIDTRPIRSLNGDQILHSSVYERLLKAREQKPDLPIVSQPTASFTFLRYIGHPDIDHNTNFLDEWAEQLAQWLKEGRDTYVFCHCPDERIDPILCRELHKRVSARVPVTPLPQLNIEANASQERLF